MKKYFLKHKYLLFIALGLINALPFLFHEVSLLSWVSFSPFLFFLAMSDTFFEKKKEICHCIFLFFFSYYFVAYHFFIALYPMTFAGIGKLLSAVLLILAWLLLSCIHSLVISTLYYYVIKISKGTIIKEFTLAFVFVLFEYFLSVGSFSFPWARFSLHQSNMPVLIQSASLFGPYFIDFLMMSTNALITAIFVSKRKVLFSCVTVLLFLSNLFFGVISYNMECTSGTEASVALIQGNVLTDSKWDGSSSYEIYMNETLNLESTHDIVVWSETAIPTELNYSQKILKELISYTDFCDNKMIVGAFYAGGNGKTYNGAYLVEDGSISEKVYFKRKLVPFGEYLPFRSIISILPFFNGINLYSSDLSEGDTTSAFKTDIGKIGALICFDSVFQNLARTTVKEGAELIVILTNDSWYKDFPAVYQHNAQAVWRAVENGRFVVRCANSGVSSFITPKGEVLSSLPPLVRGSLSEEVYFLSKNTLYTLIGDVFVYVIAITVSLLLLFENKKAFAKRQKR